MSSDNTTLSSVSLQSGDEKLLSLCSTKPAPTKPLTFQLPDFISICPYPLGINSRYHTTAVISDNWIHAHGVHLNEAQRRSYQDNDFSRLIAYGYPSANELRFRILCDYFNCLYAFDDLTDEGGLREDADRTQRAADIVMDSLRSPYTYETTFKLGRVFSE